MIHLSLLILTLLMHEMMSYNQKEVDYPFIIILFLEIKNTTGASGKKL